MKGDTTSLLTVEEYKAVMTMAIGADECKEISTADVIAILASILVYMEYDAMEAGATKEGYWNLVEATVRGLRRQAGL